MKFWIKIRSKLYFSLAANTVLFAAFAGVLLVADNTFYSFFAHIIPSFLFTSRDMALSIFSIAVSSLMAMLTLTFSIIMVVLTLYSSQMSPRSLQDFLENKITQRIMGYFIGVITFSLIVLFFIKPDQHQTPMLTPLFGVCLFLLAILVFAYLIHFISKSVQINLYIQNLSKETERLIEKNQKKIEDDPRVFSDTLEHFKELLEENDAIEVKTTQSGFLQHYEEEKLYQYAKKHEALIWCDKRVGEHVLEESTVIKIFQHSEIESIEDCQEEVSAHVLIGDEPNLYEDWGSGTKKL